MRRLLYSLGMIVFAGGIGLACSSDDKKEDSFKGTGGTADPGTGGQTMSGGSLPVGGGSATGGSAAGGGVTAGSPTTGGTPTAGTGAGGAAGGAAAGAAAGGKSAGGGASVAVCPTARPEEDSDCPAGNLSCAFATEVCRCKTSTGAWECLAALPNCPTTKPEDGTNCVAQNGACAFGKGGTCSCTGGQWQCDSGVMECPEAAPDQGSACANLSNGFDCSYATTNCTCSGNMAASRVWACTSATCPASQPAAAATCPTAGEICRYGSGGDVVCTCDTQTTWVCI